MGDEEGATPRRRRLAPQALLDVLTGEGVDFVVIGGFSLAVHGYVRATKDIDIVPDPSAPNLVRLAGALRTLRAEVDVGDLDSAELGIDPDAEGLAGGGNRVLLTRHGRLDVMQDVPGLQSYDELRGGAVEVSGVWYAGYEQLIRMKVASGRDEDLRDIGALEAMRRQD